MLARCRADEWRAEDAWIGDGVRHLANPRLLLSRDNAIAVDLVGEHEIRTVRDGHADEILAAQLHRREIADISRLSGLDGERDREILLPFPPFLHGATVHENFEIKKFVVARREWAHFDNAFLLAIANIQLSPVEHIALTPPDTALVGAAFI